MKCDQRDDVLLCLPAAGIRALLLIFNLIIRCFVCSHVPGKKKKKARRFSQRVTFGEASTRRFHASIVSET